MGVEWHEAKRFKNNSAENITVVYRTKYGFDKNDIQPNGGIVDKKSNVSIWVREVQVAWETESNPQSGVDILLESPTSMEGGAEISMGGEVFYDSKSTPQKKKREMVTESTLLSHGTDWDSTSTATFVLQPGMSIAAWQPVVQVFGNPFYLNHTVFGSHASPQIPHYQQATVHYVFPAQARKQLSQGDLTVTSTVFSQ